MASRLLPRSLRLRLTTLPPPSRGITSSSARAARHRGPRAPRTTQPPSTTDAHRQEPATRHPNASASAPAPASRLLDPDDPLNLKGTRGGRDDEPVIRFYEQDISEVGEKPPRPVSQARMDADERAAEALWKKICRLEREVYELEHGEDDLDATVLRLQAMAQGQEDPDVEMLADADPGRVRRELDALTVVVEGEGRGRAAGESVERLNNCLRHAYLATDPKARPTIRQELWKAYRRAKLHAPGMLSGIPGPAWDILFYSQAVRWKSNEKREEHMAELLDDMRSVGMDGPPTKPPGGKEVETVDDTGEALRDA